MSLVKRTTQLTWLAMFAGLVVLLASTGVSSSYAQTPDSPSKSSGSLEDGGAPDTGDPDMPTGDTPPPSTTSGSTSTTTDGGVFRGHAMSGGVTDAVSSRRYGPWVTWKLALKLFARGLIIRY